MCLSTDHTTIKHLHDSQRLHLRCYGLWVIVFFLLPFITFSQGVWRIHSNDADINRQWKNKSFTHRYLADSALHSIYHALLAEGYFDAHIDTTSSKNILYCTIQRGKSYHLGSISWDGDTLFSRRWAIRSKALTNPSFSSLLSGTSAEQRIRYLENNGYPFASAQVSQVMMSHDTLHVVWQLNLGQSIRMDSLVIQSDDKLPARYIQNYLEFRKGAVYSESRLVQYPQKLQELPFITISSPPQLLFSTGKASVYLWLKKKKANYFNGVLGIQPNDQTGKVTLTGDAEIKLVNALNTGDEIYFNWRRIQPQVQELRSRVSLPFLFHTAIGTEGDIKIFRRDSSFSSLQLTAGLLFHLNGQNRIKVFVEKNQSAQLSAWSGDLSLANFNATLWGISLMVEKLNSRLNPQQGWGCFLEIAAGKRQVSAKSLVETHTMDLHPSVFRLQGKLDYYIPTFQHQCIHIGSIGGFYQTQPLFDNEMFRIGGLQTIRGIDEASIFASAYETATVEYRYLFGMNSAVYLFADQNWYERKSKMSLLHDSPIGFGAGLNLDTRSGIFTFNYALSQQFDNPILIKNARLSFGFRNIF